MEWTIAKLIAWAGEYFSDKGIASPRLDAELLLAKSLNRSRVQLYTHFDQPLTETELAAFKELVKRRIAREPLAYIVGEKEFFSLRFQVGPEVLIPRPETEELVERGLEFLKNSPQEKPTLLDLATGSGCILLALLKNLPSASGLGVDASAAALERARQNSEALQVAERCQWLEADLCEAWPQALSGPFDLITANLPYVSEEEWLDLEPELKEFEPKSALVPGPSGLEAFAWVLPQLESRLRDSGICLLEIGMSQAEAVLEQARTSCPALQGKVHLDLSGRPRILAFTRIQAA